MKAESADHWKKLFGTFVNMLTNRYRAIIIICCAAVFFKLPAQNDSTYYSKDFLRYDNHTYKAGIKTVKLYQNTNQLTMPILNLGSDERLLLGFDELDSDIKRYSFSIIHCDARWQPTDMQAMLYVDGFNDNPISHYTYSSNTIQKYIHYTAEIPNENFTITKSGNYLLKVYEENQPDKLIITRRFMVADPKISIQARCNRPLSTNERDYKQEIDFTIFSSTYQLTNPFEDLKVIITQNGRWDNAITGLKPLFMKENELVYDYDRDNIFDGGNEFRYADLRTVSYKTERIRDITTDSNKIRHVNLVNDEKRSFKRYSTQQDINGKYIIEKRDGGDDHSESDYSWTHFSLPFNIPVTDGVLYVFGELCEWKPKEECRLNYNSEKAGYEASLYLKQGYYNYEYALMRDGEKSADLSFIEGMHFETENEYIIYVYHKQQGTYYDQLIGIKVINSLAGY